jgi:hypothetical protein
MGEQSLWSQPRTKSRVTYRFLWLRTFHKGIAVRITRDGGSATLVANRLSGAGGYEPGKIEMHRERALSDEEWNRVERALSQARFDTLCSVPESAGNDGAEWIVERATEDGYKLVERWAPPPEDAFRAACETFLDVAGRDIIVGDVY